MIRKFMNDLCYDEFHLLAADKGRWKKYALVNMSEDKLPMIRDLSFSQQVLVRFCSKKKHFP